MAGASQVTIRITLSGFMFPNPTFTANFEINHQIPFITVNMSRLTSKTATGTVVTNISPGNQLFTVFMSNSNLSPIPTMNNQTVGTFTLTFDDVPPTISSNTILSEKLTDSNVIGNVSLSIHCIHGSSLISVRDGYKRIDKLEVGDEVLSGNNLDEYATIKSIVQCWIQYPGPDHDAVIFEPNSLGLGEPKEKLIIDPGHPINTKLEFLNNDGFKSLKPAGSFIDNNKIYVRKWIDPIIQENPSIRYDLILEEPYTHYVANGIIIQSHGEYDHRYKDLI